MTASRSWRRTTPTPEGDITAPIVGATKPNHLEDALGALELELSEAEAQRLEEPYVPHPVLGHG